MELTTRLRELLGEIESVIKNTIPENQEDAELALETIQWINQGKIYKREVGRPRFINGPDSDDSLLERIGVLFGNFVYEMPNNNELRRLNANFLEEAGGFLEQEAPMESLSLYRKAGYYYETISDSLQAKIETLEIIEDSKLKKLGIRK